MLLLDWLLWWSLWPRDVWSEKGDYVNRMLSVQSAASAGHKKEWVMKRKSKDESLYSFIISRHSLLWQPSAIEFARRHDFDWKSLYPVSHVCEIPFTTNISVVEIHTIFKIIQMIYKISFILIIKFNSINLPLVIDNLYGLLLFLLKIFSCSFVRFPSSLKIVSSC